MYNTADRVGLIVKIKEAIPYIEDADLKNTAADIISKLVVMTDKNFAGFGGVIMAEFYFTAAIANGYEYRNTPG